MKSIPKPTVKKQPAPTRRRRARFHELAPAIAAEVDGPLRFIYTGIGEGATLPSGWCGRDAFISSTSFNQLREAVWSICAILATSHPAVLSQLTGLTDLAKPAVFTVLRRAMTQGRRASGYEVKCLRKVHQIAREALGYTEAELNALEKAREGLSAGGHQMAERTKRALMPYLRVPKRIGTLLDLPRQMIEDAQGRCIRYALCDWQCAVSLSLSLDALLTPADLRGLRREHLIVPVDHNLPVDVVIPSPVTASFALNVTLTPDTSVILRDYLAFLRDVVELSEVDFLFVGPDGRRWCVDLTARLAKRIKAATGHPLSLEQIGALVVALYLQKHPRDFETPKRALGLKDVSGFVERFSAVLALTASNLATRYAETALEPELLNGVEPNRRAA